MFFMGPNPAKAGTKGFRIRLLHGHLNHPPVILITGRDLARMRSSTFAEGWGGKSANEPQWTTSKQTVGVLFAHPNLRSLRSK